MGRIFGIHKASHIEESSVWHWDVHHDLYRHEYVCLFCHQKYSHRHRSRHPNPNLGRHRFGGEYFGRFHSHVWNRSIDQKVWIGRHLATRTNRHCFWNVDIGNLTHSLGGCRIASCAKSRRVFNHETRKRNAFYHTG